VLLPSISTDATRNIRSLDFSPDGQLLASMDELSYGSGGRVRVFRVSNGNLERKLDAGTQSTAVRFSPSGQFQLP
jgi:WD40 repeat protein